MLGSKLMVVANKLPIISPDEVGEFNIGLNSKTSHLITIEELIDWDESGADVSPLTRSELFDSINENADYNKSSFFIYGGNLETNMGIQTFESDLDNSVLAFVVFAKEPKIMAEGQVVVAFSFASYSDYKVWLNQDRCVLELESKEFKAFVYAHVSNHFITIEVTKNNQKVEVFQFHSDLKEGMDEVFALLELDE